MVPMRSTNDLVGCNVLEKQHILGVELNCHRASGTQNATTVGIVI